MNKENDIITFLKGKVIFWCSWKGYKEFNLLPAVMIGKHTSTIDIQIWIYAKFLRFNMGILIKEKITYKEKTNE